ncbi:lysylphosphatidylglycerol synthase domain-containing protein [Rippkaea orientalis]|nr:lysylphosphatidylglycerol synthase domain-containing protein [Rippkaea orientalis]
MVKQRLTRWFPSILSVLLFGLSVWVINQELSRYNLREVGKSLATIPPSSLLWAIALTALNYGVLTGYDGLGTIYARHLLPYRKIAFTAIISYGISNIVGFALLSSSAIRYRFYRTWGLSALTIAQLVAFCNLTFWLGLFAMGGLIFVLEPLAIPSLLHLPFASVRPLGAIFLLVMLLYLVATVLGGQPLRLGRWILPHLSVKLAVAQIIVASLDWCLAAAVFYVLISDVVSLSYPAFFGIYLLGQIAGVVSNIPGGLGVFETVMLLLLSRFIASSKLLGALLIYRGIYYFLPLFAALLLLGGYELRQRLSSR